MFKEVDILPRGDGVGSDLPKWMRDIARDLMNDNLMDPNEEIALNGYLPYVEGLLRRDGIILRLTTLENFWQYQALVFAEQTWLNWLVLFGDSEARGKWFDNMQIRSVIGERLKICTTEEWGVVEKVSGDGEVSLVLGDRQKELGRLSELIRVALDGLRDGVNEISRKPPRMLTLEELMEERAKRDDVRWVLCMGKFELGHVGHQRLLSQARRLAGPKGVVVVAVDGDELVDLFVRSRPIREDQRERAGRIEKFVMVDYVVILDFVVGGDMVKAGELLAAFQEGLGANFRLMGDMLHPELNKVEKACWQAGAWLISTDEAGNTRSTTDIYGFGD